MLIIGNGTTGLAQFPATDCNMIPDITISGAGTQNISTFIPSGSAINKKILIQSDVILNIPTTLNNCLVMINPGKKISAVASAAVLITESNLFSCGSRWFGIEIAQNGAYLDIYDSRIENAINGVYADSKNFDFITYNNDYYNNHIGIYLKGTTTLGVNYNFGNKFHGLAYTGVKVPAFQNLPAYGIKVEGLNTALLHYDIGSYFIHGITVTANQFYNLYIAGIQLDYAYSTIIGCNFSNFFDLPGTGTFFPIEAAGIISYNSDFSVTVFSGDPYPRCSFTGLDYGIFFGAERNINVGISSCDFSDCASYGIQGVLYNPALFVNISDNHFNQVVYSGSPFYAASKTYDCFRMDGTSDLMGIDNNEFNSWIAPGTSAPLAAGYQVFLNGYGAGGAPQPDFGTILGNTFNNSITGGTHFYMAHYLNTQWMVMEGNTFTGGINANYTTNWQAAFLDCRNTYVRFNTFNYSHSTDNIHFQGLYNYKFCTNTLVKSDNTGVHAYYNNSIDLSKTQFGEHPTGLYLDKIDLVDPIIGVQFHRENCWPNTTFLGKAQNDAALPANVLASKFTVKTTPACFMPAIVNPPFWFVPTSTGSSPDCQLDYPPGQMGERQYSDMSWEEKYEWYHTIAARGPLNDDEIAFMSEAQHSGIPELVHLENQIEKAVNMDEADHAALTEKANNINAKYAAIAEILKSGENGHISTHDSLQLRELIQEVTPILNSYSALGQEVKDQIQTKLHEAQNELQSASFSDQNEITYQQYLLLVIMAHQPDQNPDELHALAAQLAAKDHYEYGHGARKAHHFLADEAYRDYIAGIAQTCKDHPELLPGTNTVTAVSATHIAKIAKNVYEVAEISGAGSNYSVSDLTGRIIKSGEVNAADSRVDLSGFQPGIYYIAFANGAQTQKLFVEP